MGDSYIKKNGLLYTEDLHTVVGIDSTSKEFIGRIPYGAHRIEDEVFADTDYQSISVPDSVKELGSCLFGNCTSLQTVKLPSGIKELSPYMFSGCSSLTKVTMPNELSGFPDGLFFGCSSIEEIPFRAGITKLPEYVFAECKSLKSLVIPNTVKEIGTKAAYNCSSLESLVLPDEIQKISKDAFDGCTSLHNIRLNSDNKLFFINKEDGCLYEHTANGDELIITVYSVEHQKVKFFEENLSDEVPLTDEEDFEEDDFFSAEIGAGDDELIFAQDITQNNNNEIIQEDNKMSENEDVDSLFSDIMSDEKKRADVSEENIGISDKESMVLSEMMEVMADNPPVSTSNMKLTDDDLSQMAMASEMYETAKFVEMDDSKLDPKVSILLKAAKNSQVLSFEPKGSVPENNELIVIAETVMDDGSFSPKLITCCKKIAEIQDFKKVFLVCGLPVDNDEFMQFYYPFATKRHVILATDASSPSGLSEYCRTICSQSRINLEKDNLSEQRKRINLKNDTLIKLVIRDVK